MKAEKTFVGAVAILISIGASGCAGTTMSTFHAEHGEHGGVSGAAVATVAAPYVPEKQVPIPIADRTHGFSARVGHMHAISAVRGR